MNGWQKNCRIIAEKKEEGEGGEFGESNGLAVLKGNILR